MKRRKNKNEVFLVSQTFQCVTPESASLGDFSDQGFEFKDSPASLRDILHELREQGIEHIQAGLNSMDIYGWNYTSDDSSGEETTKCLHIKASPRLIKRLHNFLIKKNQELL